MEQSKEDEQLPTAGDIAAPVVDAVTSTKIPILQEDPAAQVVGRALESYATDRKVIKALKNAMDADGDGKTSVREVKHFRWLVVIFLIGVAVGMWIMRPYLPVTLTTVYWFEASLFLLGFVCGIFFYWLFDKEISQVEDQVVEKIDKAINK